MWMFKLRIRDGVEVSMPPLKNTSPITHLRLTISIDYSTQNFSTLGLIITHLCQLLRYRINCIFTLFIFLLTDVAAETCSSAASRTSLTYCSQLRLTAARRIIIFRSQLNARDKICTTDVHVIQH